MRIDTNDGVNRFSIPELRGRVRPAKIMNTEYHRTYGT